MAKVPLKLVIGFLLLIAVLQLATIYMIKSQPRAQYVLPKVLWFYWDRPQLPSLIAKIKAYNAPKFAGWQVIYLNETLLPTYVPDYAYPPNYEGLRPAHKADWLRLYLLSVYGGCWMDASILVNSPTAMGDLYNESLLVQSDLTCFQIDDGTFIHRTGRVLPKVIENWFIMAPKNSKLISLWRQEFENAIKMGFLKYRQSMSARSIDISAINFENAEDVYLTQHIAIQAVVQNPTLEAPPMVIKKSQESMLKLHQECKWISKCIADHLNSDPAAKRLPYIKLTRHDREENLDRFFDQQA